MRLDQWRIAATLLARMPFASLDETARGRLSYALLMLNRSDPANAHKLFKQLLDTNSNLSAPLSLELATIAIRIRHPPLYRELLAQAISKSNDTATYDAAATLLALHNAHEEGSLATRIDTIVEEAGIPAAGLLTLVPLSSRYLDLWSLWIEQQRKHIGGTVVVIALDDEVLTPLRNEPQVAVIDAREFVAWKSPGSLHDASRGVLWQIRTWILRDLLRRDRTTLVLDLDAIPLSNLQPLFDSIPDADVIAQEDHSLPMDVNRKFGFILCCGFMLWRPTVAAKKLLDRFATEVMIERDDQLALNHILARDGISNRGKIVNSMQFESKGVHIACPDPTEVSRTLHNGTILRHFQQKGHTVPQLKQALGLYP
jgi:hypothetical protein